MVPRQLLAKKNAPIHSFAFKRIYWTMTNPHLIEFFELLERSLKSKNLHKLTLSKARTKQADVKNIQIKLVQTKKGDLVSVVYRHPTNDVTKNFQINEALREIEQLLETQFLYADLFTSQGDMHLSYDKKNKTKLKRKKAKDSGQVQLTHDRSKKRLISLENNIYLRELDIVTSDWKVKRNREDKYRQINKFVEVVGAIIENQKLSAGFSVVDMGCGKGYLTFALYDYLVNQRSLQPHITGVELRPALVDTCNKIAQKAGFDKLNFHAGAIEKANLDPIDILIALHACDTATDDAIFRGLEQQSKIIICAPCCHKQIRKDMQPTNDLKAITRFGILEERQAEILTDGLRSLILEAHGYKTKVFEFISTEHTPKNVLIVAIKDKELSSPDPKILEQIRNIKELYQIKQHYLEKLLKLN